jgi:hypothetical protein
MATYKKSITGRNEPVTVNLNIAASQTITAGDLLQINATSRKGEAAVAASSALFGIAQADITTGASVTSADSIPVTLLEGAVIRIAYTGSTKTTLAETDLYSTAFDLSDKKTLNLDDTTGGMCKVLAYDNDNDTADVVIARANLALQ